MKLLIVEDDPERICWFFNVFVDTDMTLVNNAKDAIVYLNEIKYDLVFLDHDLGCRVFVESSDTNTGMQVVKSMMTSKNTTSRFVIHSWNPVGAENMRSYLCQSCPEAKVHMKMFGSFDKNVLYN